MKVAYIGIDLFFPALQSIYSCENEILKIFTCKTNNKTEFNIKIIEFANTNNIPYTLDRITSYDIAALKELGCELIISAGYYYRIPVDNDIPMINIHPSLLPIGRGPWPMPIIILKRHKKSGVTFHKISQNFDEGDIILQREFIISDNENLKSYMEKVYALVDVMTRELFGDFRKIYNSAIKQNVGEYWKEPDESVFTFSQETSFKDAEIALRAFYGYECYYIKDDTKYEIIDGVAVMSKEKGYMYFPLKQGYIQCKRVEEVVDGTDRA